LVGYEPGQDVVLFTANGATGAINFLARALFPPEVRSIIKRFPDGAPQAFVETFAEALGARGAEILARLQARPLVVSSRMEHHSNLLPWIEAVGRHNFRVAPVDPIGGAIDLDALARILEEEGDRVRLVAITATSNVTGIATPVHDVARLAHAVGAELMVDGAQWVPHAPVSLHRDDPAEDIDYLVFSGHKLYAPGSRGALIGKLSTLRDARCVTDVGGGMVEYVSMEDYEVKEEVTAREEAGTPNILGTIAMGLVANALLETGMDVVQEREQRLTIRLVERLSRVPSVRILGSTDLQTVHRAGVVSFDVGGVPYGLVASYLDDFHNIAVRDGCFCANPYVRDLLGCTTQRPTESSGLVRASLGIYSTEDDIEDLGLALEALVKDRERIAALYGQDEHGWRLQEGPPTSLSAP
jgi:selenocysteine lyase/cysteine desulfurase